MGSATASPEVSPTRVETRPGSEIYVSKQRGSLTGEEPYSVEDDVEASTNDKPDNQDSGVVRKGRGTFRGPTNDSQQDPVSPGSRTPRGRDFDATALRQYPPKSGEKPQRGGGKKKTKSGQRQNSNGGPAGSDSGESGSDSIIDELSKLAISPENSSIGKNEQESKPAVQQQHSETTSPISQDHQSPQTEEEWERLTDEAKALVSGQLDGQKQPDFKQQDGQKTENGPRYKKGHKKSKSRNEYNFDPDAYEGSTRILDVFDFPASFKTHHLHEIFQEYENMRGGYRIKWMEDTRALIIFEHPATARKAYLDNVNNQMAQIKPYDGPTDFLQKNATATQPRTRPVTTDVVARRLVHGALGVRVQRSPEQRQAERQMLQNAREQLDQKRSDGIKRAQDLDTTFNE